MKFHSVILIVVIMRQLNIHVGLLINAPPWQPIMKMHTHISEIFSLFFYHTALPHNKSSLPVNILTLYAKKNTVTDVFYCIALSMLCHFDVHKHNTTSDFIIKQAIIYKLHCFTWRQHWHIAPIICGIYKNHVVFINFLIGLLCM